MPQPAKPLPPFADEAQTLVHVIIESPRGSRNKFAWEPETGYFKLKGILPAGTAFPLDFGFIPGTKGEDGDPIDVLVLLEQATYPGCLLECRLIGIIKGEQRDKDSNEYTRNDRLLAIPEASKDYGHMRQISDFGQDRLEDVLHFFQYYNSMKGGEYRSLGTAEKEEALKMIKEGIL